MMNRKKLAALTLSLAMAISVIPVQAAAAEAADAVEISSAADLATFAERVSSGETTLDAEVTADIDMQEYTSFVGVGTADSPYAGTFDGNGHTITVSMEVDGTGGTNNRAGIIAFASGATITDVVMDGSITAYNGCGIVGCTVSGETTIENCVNRATLNASDPMGGILGEAKAMTTIRNCENYGDLGASMMTSGNENGGIVGKLNSEGCVVENCANYGVMHNHLVGSGVARIGGIVGSVAAANCIIRNSFNTAVVEGNHHVGGIVGEAADGLLVENCFNTGNVYGQRVNSGQQGVGGIVGTAAYKKNVTVRNCYNTGIISGSGSSKYAGVAGIVGYISDTFTMENCYNAGSINCVDTVSHGSVLGNSQRTGNVLTNCYWLENTDTAMFSGVSQTVSGIVDATSAEVMASAEFAASLGDGFQADTSNVNNGQPILAWQANASAVTAAEALIDAIGTVTKESGEAISAAREAYDALTETQQAQVSNYETLTAAEALYAKLTNVVKLTVSGEDETHAFAENVSYTVSAQDMLDMTTFEMTITLNDEVLTDVEATSAADGWFIIAQQYQNGVLNVVAGNNTGVSGDSDLLTITAKPTGKGGEATVQITEARLAGYDGEGEAYLQMDLTNASTTTQVIFNVYDVNHDGVVNLLDITRAQRYYGTNNTVCDVNHDGTVDISDLILILNNYFF